MTVNDAIRGLAGFFVLSSVALGYLVHPAFLLFTAFVGANLFQSSFSKWCPMIWILRKLGLKDVLLQPKTACCDAQETA